MNYASTKQNLSAAKDDAVADLRDGASETARAVKREAEVVSASVARGINNVTEAAKETASNIGEDMRKAAGTVSDGVKEGSRAVKSYVTEKTDLARSKLESEAQNNPLRSLGFAALAGLVVGAILAR